MTPIKRYSDCRDDKLGLLVIKNEMIDKDFVDIDRESYCIGNLEFLNDKVYYKGKTVLELNSKKHKSFNIYISTPEHKIESYMIKENLFAIHFKHKKDKYIVLLGVGEDLISNMFTKRHPKVLEYIRKVTKQKR